MDNPLNRTCPICGEPAAEQFLRKLELQLVRCIRCSMIYANPVPVEMATGNFYDKAGSEYLTSEKLESDYADVRFERELRLFHTHCRSGSECGTVAIRARSAHRHNHFRVFQRSGIRCQPCHKNFRWPSLQAQDSHKSLNSGCSGQVEVQACEE